MIYCSKCKVNKNPGEFHSVVRPGKTRQHFNSCKPCRSAYDKSHKIKNYAKVQAKKLSYIKSKQDWILDYLQSHPCVDCGETDPVVLEFDHVRGKKSFTIGSKIRSTSIKAISLEVEKCDVRCANCHRRKTLLSTKSYRTLRPHRPVDRAAVF